MNYVTLKPIGNFIKHGAVFKPVVDEKTGKVVYEHRYICPITKIEITEPADASVVEYDKEWFAPERKYY